MHSDPLRKKTFWSPESFFYRNFSQCPVACCSKGALGSGRHPSSLPAGHPRHKRPRRAPRHLAAGHPRNKRPRRAPKEQRGTAAPTVPKDSVCRRHPRNKWWWEQAASRPRKLSGLEKAPIQKKNFPTPEKFLFWLGPRQSAPLTAAAPAAGPLHWPPQQSEPWQFRHAKTG